MKHVHSRIRTGLFSRLAPLGIAMACVCGVSLALAAAPGGADSAAATAAIPWSELGARATAQYSGDGLSIRSTPDGVMLRCAFQRLEGRVTTSGLWLASSVEAEAGEGFGMKSVALGRTGRPATALAAEGHVETETGLVRWVRENVVEEYKVGVDGVRQDFLVLERPDGEGELRLELAMRGASAEPVVDGMQLALDGSDRRLVYNRLKVFDAAGRELDARFSVVSAAMFAVVVDDVGAAYPIRIDPTFSDADWYGLGGLNGASERVQAVAVDPSSGAVYIGGKFTAVGDLAASRIAKWDGSSWSTLGSGLNDTVNALAVDGSGNIYAGGYFTTAGGIPASRVAKWDGSVWSAMGLGVNSMVEALVLDSAGNLYVGGGFATAGGASASRIAKWDGSAWSALGSGVGNIVYALAVDGAGSVYAGGAFTNAGVVAANRIAKWDGSAWGALGQGFNNTVSKLAADGVGSLYAAGTFTNTGAIAVSRIAKWDGNIWSPLGSGLSASCSALGVDGAGNVYAGGSFSTAGGTAVNYIAKWNGIAWSALGSGLGYSIVNALTVDNAGNIYAGGDFPTAGGIPASRIAKWNGSAWSALANGGLSGNVKALHVDDAGTLYAGGEFTTAAGVTVNRISRWSGSSWVALGSGMNGSIQALTADNLGNVYAGGSFATAGGVSISRIAKWDGSAWSALGLGLNNNVWALAVDGSGNLYAGGDFTTAGGVSASRIAKWDGSAWSALGSGLGDKVNALAWNNAGSLYAGGNFTNAGGVAVNRIAQWNGSAWSTLGSGMNSVVNALTMDGAGNLYAGGDFSTAGGVSASKVAKWDGNSWSALGSGINAMVYALETDGVGNLYSGGSFSMAGGVSASRIAKWDGTSWSALGSGLNQTVYALTQGGARDLYVGGAFTTAGGKPAGYAAHAVLELPAATAPTLFSPTAIGIGQTVATLGATVSTDGGATLSARGTVWGASINPTGNALAEGGTIVGAFSHARTEFPAGSLIYYRGYAVNAVGTGYSGNGTFWTVPANPAAGAATDITTTSFTANWGASAGSTNYLLDVATDDAFTSFVSGYEARGAGDVTTYPVTGLSVGQTYYYRVRASNSGGTSGNSGTIPVTTLELVTFQARVPSWANHNPSVPQVWGPFTGAEWTGRTMTYDAGTGWWIVEVAVADAAAAITYQLRFCQDGATKYQKKTGDFGANPTFTTTTGEIWIDAADNGSFTWQGNDFNLPAGKITETQPKEDQTITFETGAWQGKTYGDAPFDLVASASSGLGVAFASDNEAVATVAGATVTIVGAGQATIMASQAGNASYNSAPQVERVLTVAQAAATVELLNLTGHVYDGTAKEALAATVPEGLTVELIYAGGATAPTNAGSYAVVATVDDANYAGSASGTLVIDKADQTIDFAAIGDKITTDAVILSATASSGLAVSYDVTGPAHLAGTILTFTGAGEVGVTAKQVGDLNWNAAVDVVRTFNVALAPSGPQLSRNSVNVREAGEGRFFVRLDNPPAANVIVSVSRSTGDASLMVKSGASLTFKPSNWSVWQAVTLAQAADDGNEVNETATFFVATEGADDQFVTATALDDDVGENVALAASRSTIGAVNGGRPADLIDGLHASSTNYGTLRFPPAKAGTMTLDLKAATELSRVRLLNWDWDVRYHQYKIEWSLDGANWTMLADAMEGEHRGWEDWDAMGVTAQYLKITAQFNSANPTLCIAEWEVYAPRTLPDLPQVQLLASGVNVREGGEGRVYVRLDRAPLNNFAVGLSRIGGDADVAVQGSGSLAFTPNNWPIWQPVTLVAGADENALDETATFLLSSPFAVAAQLTVVALDDDLGDNVALASAGSTIAARNGGRPADLIDGVSSDRLNYGTLRFPPASVGTMTLDLKTATALSRVRVLHWDWDVRYHQYKIEWSLDNKTWTMLADATEGEHRGWEDWAATGVTARYLKLTAQFNSANPTLCIAEWEVYGAGGLGRRSLDLAKAGAAKLESEPILVLTSDGPEDQSGWLAVDGDPETTWVGHKAGGGYLVVEYAPTLTLKALEVDLAGDSLIGIESFFSQDGVKWQALPEDMEMNPISLNFLWLTFPSDGTEAVPQIIEIWPNP